MLRTYRPQPGISRRARSAHPLVPRVMTAPLSYGSSSLVDRMRRAAMLDASLYEEVEHDTTATGQAAVVVAIAAVASAIGNAWRGGPGVIAGLAGSLLGWAAWSGIAYLVGTRVFGGRATWGEVLRTVGFAQAPGVLLVLALIPILGGLVKLGVGIWMLATGWVALRAALDLDGLKTLLTVVLGWLALVLIQLLLASVMHIRMY